MKIIKLIAIVLLAIIIIKCSPSCDIKSTQDIEIHHYAENDKNAKLVEDLIFYDPRYIALKIPALNESTLKGIELSYFISSERKPIYRVTYSFKNLISVGADLSELKEGFGHFIPKLAAIHASKEPLFVELEPRGRSWVTALFSNSASTLWDDSSTLLKEAFGWDQFAQMSTRFSSKFGKPLEVLFIRAQYYEDFGRIPEFVSLFYLAKFAAQPVLTITIDMHQPHQKWLVVGFEIFNG